MPTQDQEPRIWYSITSATLVDGSKYFIRLFASPYLPLYAAFDSASNSFQDPFSTLIFPHYEVAQVSDFYPFP